MSDAIALALREPVSGAAEAWPEPQPIHYVGSPQRYPIEALPDRIRAAVVEAQEFVQAPMPLVAASALSVVSTVLQGHIDVERADRLRGPVSFYFLSIAESGERKSTCDEFFSAGIRNWEGSMRDLMKSECDDHIAATLAWETKISGLRERIRLETRNGKCTLSYEEDLKDLKGKEPRRPLRPRVLYGDITPEALAYGLSTEWPVGAIICPEAGSVFGSHGMGRDSIMRNLSQFNTFWDGKPLTIDRRTTESIRLDYARLTMGLQVQEATLRTFSSTQGALARGIGFYARFLVACPASTQGQRLFVPAPRQWLHLDTFKATCEKCLDRPPHFAKGDGAGPIVFEFDAAASEAWIRFHDEIEKSLGIGGTLADVRDVASKAADNVARLAALFQAFDRGLDEVEIRVDYVERACRIVKWHLNEALRFFGQFAMPEEQVNAMGLEQWLVNYCDRHGNVSFIKREVQRLVSGKVLRKKECLDEALRILSDADRVRLAQVGRRTDIHLNPALLGDSMRDVI